MTPGPRSILFVHPSDEPYGADRILLAMAVDAHRRGARVLVVLPDDAPPGWLTAHLSAHGIEVRRCHLAVARRRYWRIRNLPSYLLMLRRAAGEIRAMAREIGADLIHVNTTAILAGALVGRPRGARLVWHVHEIIVRPRLVALMMRTLPALAANRVIAVSEAVARHLIAPGPLRRRVVVIRNGIADRVPANDRDTEPRRPLIAFIGRLNGWKGYDLFVDATARLARRRPGGFGVAIAGGPPPGEAWRADDLSRRIEAGGLAGQAEILGQVDDVAALLDRIDIVVVPSTWPEPFGLVILEGMRAARPVVASRHGGALEMLEDGVTGVLVPPNDPDALMTGLDRLLADPALRRRLGIAARERFLTTFGEEAFLCRIAKLHATVMEIRR
jgi:glycosyltransferase involved in cell wall biosynthesis